MTYATPHIHTCNYTARHRAVMLVLYVALLLGITPATAQILIKGNVYGGGNEGKLTGNTNVELRGGVIEGSVYGGARMADVTDRTYVNINAAAATSALVVEAVYGGNDIAGVVGADNKESTMPTIANKVTEVDHTWDAIVQATAQTAEHQFPVIIGALYGGGNGGYGYAAVDDEIQVSKDGAPIATMDASKGLILPTLAKTYLHIEGGVFGHIYGGGNAVTVTDNTVIYTNNTTALDGPLNSITTAQAAKLGLFEGVDYRVEGEKAIFDYHASRVFGGNNVEPMGIRPTWHLQRMDINNLYSGGNRGAMMHANGIILPIQSDDLRANNVYGGCRIADVNPGGLNGAATLTDETLYGHDFHAGYATRVYITAGRVNNVYGGNDIAGKVYHGSNVDIHGGLIGNVYGGGNGSYAYTDNPDWRDKHPEDADYYYIVGGGATAEASLEALYNFRPHVESTLVHISGESEEKRIVVTGDVYCGGNSATLAKAGDQTAAKSTFRVGKYATIDGVFLGSNGENMVLDEILVKYASKDGEDIPFSRINLKEETNMAAYMKGVAMNIKPELLWDDIAQTTYVGSLYFGGNKGSMTYEGMNTINVPRDLIIYEKIVGGCNDACVEAGAYNAAYHGGLLEPGEDTQKQINVKNNKLTEIVEMKNVKVWLNVDAYLMPKTLTANMDASGRFVESTTFDWDVKATKYETFDNVLHEGTTFQDANIYGGCFNSGHIEGGTVVNITKSLIHEDVYKQKPDILHATGEDVYGSAMAVYGAGYGEQSVVEGDTYVFLSEQARLLLAFGGGEMGVVEGNTTVTLDKDLDPSFSVDGVEQDSLNVYKVYGAGYAGTVEGNSTLNIHGGGVMRAFAGACNADVNGYTTAYVGWRDEIHDIYGYGRPYVRNAVFGGNDFGGKIHGNTLRTIKIDMERTQQVRSQTYVHYVSGNIGKAIYGGSYGSYNYEGKDADDVDYGDFTAHPEGYPDFLEKIVADNDKVIATNTFVDISSLSLSPRDIIGSSTRDALAIDPSSEVISGVVGGGRGYRNQPGYVKVNQTYVLLHATEHAKRNPLMAYRVYGGGNLSTVDNTRIDLYSGNVERVFGGTHGVKTVTTDDNVAYNVQKTMINVYDGMDFASANIFGAGANSGADKAYINLYGGQVNDVHGGAFTEGYTLETYINVPKGSTAQVNAIYGGGLGEEEGRPCDVGLASINYASGDASVKVGVFGGNHNARATSESIIRVSAPLVYKYKDQLGNPKEDFVSVYGAGYGSATVSGFTLIDLLEGAHVGKAYGGGKEGKVYNHYNYYGHTGDAGVDFAINDYYDNAPHRHANWINGMIQPEATKTAPKPIDEENTHIIIRKGAVVEENVYGGGEGTTAFVDGESHVLMLGGLVKGDIYGGGDAGDMARMKEGVNGYIAAEAEKQTIGTLCEIIGGQARKVFGGGLNGDIEGKTHVIIGAEEAVALIDDVDVNVFPDDEVDAGSSLAPGRRSADEPLSFYNGMPAIQRNVYGGSERALVSDSAIVEMYNGYIGYEYAGIGKAATPIGDYHPVLDLDADIAVREFEDEGNLYGAGYGEGAVVINTLVNLYGGTIRNSVYGGGEIAAVGVGEVSNNRAEATITTPGNTEVRIYGGLVEGDVFGGGRGYTYTYTYTGENSPYKTSREYTDGYVFGHTDVEIYRGTIGTDESVAQGKGNVFGGGNIGYVYSPGKKYTGETNGNLIHGHYYHVDNPATIDIDESHERTEDCRVHITARCRALEDVTVGGKAYKKGEYVLTEDLNKLEYGDTEVWEKLDKMGLTIRNAVFAGGNVTSGTDLVYANAVTVYGNATAAVIDVFAKDFVRLGGDHVGGLYGDGNLTFVDGYRELNITNYGTDYYNLSQELTYEQYLKLSDLEKDYYSLIYELKDGGKQVVFTYDGVEYQYLNKGDEIDDYAYRQMMNAWLAMKKEEMKGKWTISGSEYVATALVQFTSVDGVQHTYYNNTHLTEAAYEAMMAAYVAAERKAMDDLWAIKGMCAITAGRMMNTVQRTDFCGMFGSRVVLHGAQDRVPDEVDYTNYTINRVGEISLNQVTEGTTTHGNYFGIYNVVNFLGSLTSDVEMEDVRQAVGSPDLPAVGNETYYDFKAGKANSSKRNNGSSPNMVAMASGVYLELVKELDADGNKVYGPITGVVQLDLINVQPGEGGGYVYAKNEHGVPHEVDESLKEQMVLSDANEGAVTSKAFTYEPDEKKWGWMQTSGNFVHPQKRIVDDCFPLGYVAGSKQSPAHYWYVRGNFYVYNQYLSAYSGAAEAYADSVNIPLTITASSDGYMQLVSVDPNMYAYFDGKYYKDQLLTKNDSILVNGTTYHMNDPISYWEWSQLADADKEYFVETTYVAICDATISGTNFTKGDVILPDVYNSLAPNGIILEEGGKELKVRTDSVIRISNEISHGAGYIITADMNNPQKWDNYYTLVNGSEKILRRAYDKLTTANKENYHKAPTLKCTESGVYGQLAYEEDDVVRYAVVEEYAATGDDEAKAAFDALQKQATFEPAYITVKEVSFTYDGQPRHMFEGSYISKTMYDALSEADKACFEPAYVCVETIEEADKVYILNRELISQTKYNELMGRTATEDLYLKGVDMDDHFDVAYICTEEGNYGGSYFKKDVNYPALDYCNLNAEERAKFTYNYDAFDLLISDFDFDLTKYGAPYYEVQPIDYTASYMGKTSHTYKKRRLEDGVYKGNWDVATIDAGASLMRDEYELILNEQSHYVPLKIDDIAKPYYVVKAEFERANIYYPAGSSIEEYIYNSLTSEQKDKVEVFEENHFAEIGTVYFCIESYLAADIDGNYKKLTTVNLGEVIDKDTYDNLPNYQGGLFTISGNTPVEKSTLYVPRASDILSLSQDRVVTLVFKYTFKEQDASGGGYEKFAEKHILNIHVKFKSGEPTIGSLTPPTAVLPNSTVGLSVPTVTPGAYEVIGGGWEIYETPEDAEKHRNGVVFKNNATPMYWYQNGYLVAYYAKSHLGRTYSNPVPLTIANYHRLGEVMSHVVNGKHEYMYIDHKNVDRNSKIYLDSAAYVSTSIAAGSLLTNDLDYLKKLYDASLDENELDGRVRACDNLEFILRSDIAPKEYADNWTSIGTVGNCFSGSFHGNGYTISGLSNSLFGYLCDSVYNVGVMGSFTGAGIADNGGSKGYAENCWVYTNTKEALTMPAVIGQGGSIVNSYYRADNEFVGNNGATVKTQAEFEKGDVAYLLNGFYLDKRYRNNNADAADDALTGYVERYYKDGDFIYAAGKIVKETDARYDEEQGYYVANYPHDYIYFGQKLTYEEATHNSLPVRVIKVMEDGVEHVARNGNRVYRAPAYYLSDDIDKIYFNAEAYFAERWKDMNLPVRPTTAIDFTGFNDKDEAYDNTKDYRPFLDYEGLNHIDIKGMTRNLLLYADPVGDATSYDVLDKYIHRPVLDFGNYNEVGVQSNMASMHGHLVDLRGGQYVATSNHFLVDKDNFNAPIEYRFDNGCYMWYQRTPQAYAEGDGGGWDALCLPFTADLTTTQTKGQITHFYGDSTANHEYWLRELNSVELGEGGADPEAKFLRPDAVEGQSLAVDNTFLYDYYYVHSDDKHDANDDLYQNYYRKERVYDDYPYIAAHTPYIVAFPGERYYEFDMSGKFQPKYTGNTIPLLPAQVVTMVSVDNDVIRVTDEAMKTVSANGYSYRGTFNNATVTGDSYVLNAAGNTFEHQTDQKVVPFRAYMSPSSGAAPRRILIGNAGQEEEPTEEILQRGLKIWGKGEAIYIESTLEYEAVVTIHSLSGQIVNRVTVKPMSKEVVPVSSRGVYIVNQKKIAVL